MDTAQIKRKLSVDEYPHIIIAGKLKYHILAVDLAALRVHKRQHRFGAEQIVVRSKRHKSDVVGLGVFEHPCLGIGHQVIFLAVVFIAANVSVVNERHLVGTDLLAVLE